ncbi:hypothetical protein SDC9_112019 [bioreactor metagenome]|uniref:Uncharacterized protein n=1 Tax=bioreactor metagenome TaxID=1076179 RepID=A0A645BID0_9ZZZZ
MNHNTLCSLLPFLRPTGLVMVSALGALRLDIILAVADRAESPRAAFEGRDTRPGHLNNTVRHHKIEEGLNLVQAAGHLKGHRGSGDIDDLCLEDLGKLHHLRAAFTFGGDLDHDQLALQAPRLGHLIHALDIDELAHLLLDLLDSRTVAADYDGDAADRLVLRFSDRQAVDVVASSGEQGDDTHQDTGVVVDQDGQCVAVFCTIHVMFVSFVWCLGISDCSPGFNWGLFVHGPCRYLTLQPWSENN